MMMFEKYHCAKYAKVPHMTHSLRKLLLLNLLGFLNVLENQLEISTRFDF